MPSSIVESLGVNASLYADYGKVCGAHDALSLSCVLALTVCFGPVFKFAAYEQKLAI